LIGAGHCALSLMWEYGCAGFAAHDDPQNFNSLFRLR
jgi:hypothetical protein